MENAVNSTTHATTHPAVTPLVQQLVTPSQIESELILLWQTLATEKKTRASLFNLVIFNHSSSRTDAYRSMAQQVVAQFPCRILFVTYDPNAPHPYLKTAISVVAPQGRDSSIACDQIDIGAGGASSLEPIPSLLLPHLIPDLPVYLLWTEDPSLDHPLFRPLISLATRAIFDSTTSNDLASFAMTLLQLKAKLGIDIADLNWARTEGWRDLIASLFSLPEAREQLKKISLVKLTYQTEVRTTHEEGEGTTVEYYVTIQSLYLLSWLTCCLDWRFEKQSPDQFFEFKGVNAKIEATTYERLSPGTLTAIYLHSTDGYLFRAERIPTQYHQVKVEISTPDRCELPYLYMLGKTASGHSLAKEITTQGTSSHYLATLQTVSMMYKELTS